MENQTGQELEALAIAQRIKEIVGKEQIVSVKKRRRIPACGIRGYCNPLRTAYGWAETFREVLASQGIPVYCTSRTGYFSAAEIVTVLNYLKVCDNPLQDIPLMGVLRSPSDALHRNWQSLEYSILMVCSMRVFWHMQEKMKSPKKNWIG